MKVLTTIMLAALAAYGQDASRVVVAADAGSTDAYVIAPTYALGAYVDKLKVRFFANTCNTGAATINISSLGAKAIKKMSSGSLADPSDNDICGWAEIVYRNADGVFQLLATPSSGGGGGSGAPYQKEFVAAVCQSAAGSLALNAATATQPATDCSIGTNGAIFGFAQFANTGTFSVQGSFLLPSTVSSASADITWSTSVTNTSLGAVWQLETACVADNESVDPTFNAVQYTRGAAKSTANYRITNTISSVTLTGCAANETLFWRLSRVPGSTGGSVTDDLGATANLHRIRFTVQ